VYRITKIIIVGIFLLLDISSPQAFDIIEPSEGQKFEVGSVIRVVIKPQSGEKITSVGVGFDEIPYNSTLGAFVREFPVSKEAKPGEIVLKIEALTETKEILQATRNIYLTLPASVALQGITVDRSRIFLTKVPEDVPGAHFYERSQIHVKGQYSDGIERDVSPAATGTTYASSDEKIAMVDSKGLVAAVGEGTTKIAIKNGVHSLVIDVVVKPKR